MPFVIGIVFFCMAMFLISVLMNMKEKGIDYFESEGGGFLILKKRSSKYKAYFTIEEAHYYYSRTEPVKIHYGSATVGGVTTGGYYTTGGQQTIREGVQAPGKYILCYKGKMVKFIQFNNFQQGDEPLLIKAKQDKIIGKYISDKDVISIIPKAEKMSVPSAKKALFLQTGNYQYLLDEVINNYPSREKCQDIIDWICQDE